MMRNPVVVRSCLALSLAAALIAGTSVVDADTQVEFSGALVSEPCQIAVGDEEQQVDFRAIAAKTFISHPRSAPARFSIRLAECDLSLGTQVSVTFSGQEDSSQPGTFAVTGEAKGVAIALGDGEGKDLQPEVPQKPVALQEGDVVLDYQAWVQALDFERVTEGEFTALVTFFLDYE